MATKIIKLDGTELDSAEIKEAAAKIEAGGLLALYMPEVPVEKKVE